MLLAYIKRDIQEAGLVEIDRDFDEISADRDYVLSIIQDWVDHALQHDEPGIVKLALEDAKDATEDDVISDNITWVLETRF